MDNKEYIIGEIIDNKTQKRKEIFENIIGKRVYIVEMEEDKEMLLALKNSDDVIQTSVVEDVDQTDYGFWVTTTDLTYRLDTEGLYKIEQYTDLDYIFKSIFKQN